METRDQFRALPDRYVVPAPVAAQRPTGQRFPGVPLPLAEVQQRLRCEGLLRGRRDLFAFGTLASGLATLALLFVINVTGFIMEACRLAASPQLRNMGSIGGNLLQATRCWYWRLAFPCRLHGGDVCQAQEGQHREHAIFANSYCASAHPSDLAATLLALGATLESLGCQVGTSKSQLHRARMTLREYLT